MGAGVLLKIMRQVTNALVKVKRFVSPDHRVVKRLFEGIHPTFLRDRKCQVPNVSKPFLDETFKICMQ